MLESMGLRPKRRRLKGMIFTDLDNARDQIKDLIFRFTGGEGTSSAWHLSRLDDEGCVVGAAEKVRMVEEVSDRMRLTTDGVAAIMELFMWNDQATPVSDRIGEIDFEAYFAENPEDEL